ncbi:MAG: GcrA cell cycle regulator, partial [Oxalobacteraceae bacterium]
MEWNDEAIARIRALWSEGHSTAEIGRRMGISKNAVVGKAHRLNLPARPSPIRRGSGEKRATTRATIRRVTGPTLPALESLPRVVEPVPVPPIVAMEPPA